MHCDSHLRSARAAGLGSRARRTLCAFVTVALAAMCIPQSGFSKQSTVTVPTTSGLVRGQFSDDGSIEIFRGIPSAPPPVGSLRWAAPQPPAPWSGVLDAFQARTPCPQTGQYASLDEDCLYLNVFVPFRYANNKLPSWYGRRPLWGAVARGRATQRSRYTDALGAIERGLLSSWPAK